MILLICYKNSTAKANLDPNRLCFLFVLFVDAVAVDAVDTTPPTKSLANG